MRATKGNLIANLFLQKSCPYATLGLQRSCSTADIRTAFQHLARRHHPDVGIEKDTEKFQNVLEAYTKLKTKHVPIVPTHHAKVTGKADSALFEELQKWMKSAPPPPTPPTSPPPTEPASDRSSTTVFQHCALCSSVMNIAVHVKVEKCCVESDRHGGGFYACMSCARDALGLNGVTKQRCYPSLAKCVHCRAPVKRPLPAEKSYRIDASLGACLDRIHGDALCPCCKEWTGTRKELVTHLKTCRLCNQCREVIMTGIPHKCAPKKNHQIRR